MLLIPLESVFIKEPRTRMVRGFFSVTSKQSNCSVACLNEASLQHQQEDSSVTGQNTIVKSEASVKAHSPHVRHKATVIWF